MERCVKGIFADMRNWRFTSPRSIRNNACRIHTSSCFKVVSRAVVGQTGPCSFLDSLNREMYVEHPMFLTFPQETLQRLHSPLKIKYCCVFKWLPLRPGSYSSIVGRTWLLVAIGLFVWRTRTRVYRRTRSTSGSRSTITYRRTLRPASPLAVLGSTTQRTWTWKLLTFPDVHCLSSSITVNAIVNIKNYQHRQEKLCFGVLYNVDNVLEFRYL